MKKLIIFWIATVLSISTVFAIQKQDTTIYTVQPLDSTLVILPDSIAGKVIAELIIKDHLEFEVKQLKDIIKVQITDINGYKEQIEIYKTNDAAYIKVIADLRDIIAEREAKLKDKDNEIAEDAKVLKKEKRKGVFKTVVGVIIIGVEAVVIVLLVAR